MSKILASYFVDLVQDACLKAFWTKKALRIFLHRHGISEKYTSPLDTGMVTKSEVLSVVFSKLTENPTEKKQAVILSIAGSLVEMETFPDLEKWEDASEKIKTANEAVGKLRVQYEKLRTAFIDEGSEEKKKKAREEADAYKMHEARFTEFNKRLLDVVQKAGTQEGGYEFERWLYDFAGFNDIESRPPYKGADGRQVDGALTIGGTTYLLEAKCTKEPVDVTAIDSFMRKISVKADNTMGLLISVSGFDPGAIKAASCERTPMLLIDGNHLFSLIMARRFTLRELIELIRRHASQTGIAYLPVKECVCGG